MVAELAAAELPGSQRKGKPGRHPPLSPCNRILLALPGFFTLLGGQLEEKDETLPLATPDPYSSLNMTVATLKTAREGTDLSRTWGLNKAQSCRERAAEQNSRLVAFVNTVKGRCLPSCPDWGVVSMPRKV